MDVNAGAKSIFSSRISKAAPDVATGAGRNRTVVRSYSAAVLAEATGLTHPARGRSTVKYRISTAASRAGKFDAGTPTYMATRCGHYSDAHVGVLASHTVKSTDFVPTVGTSFDMTAVCRRLGQFIAKSTSGFGHVPTSCLLGGAELSAGELVSSGMHFDNAGVYITMKQGSNQNEDLLGVILYAARGCGAEVYTGSVYVSQNRWKVCLPRRAGALDASFKAVRLIIDSAELSGVGGAHLAAFVIGLHDITSVVAHTDDGNYMRDVMRGVELPTPSGIISGSPPPCVQLPMSVGGRHNVRS